MGKASRWFRAVLGLRKPDPTQAPPSSNPEAPPPKDKPKRWSFVKSYREKTKRPVSFGRDHHPQPSSSSSFVAGTSFQEQRNPKERAIAVAAATAAAAEAAVAAAQAAAEVVRLTSSGRPASNNNHLPTHAGSSSPEEAAVRIQSAFRGYLARRALRALKALVRLQALVRGHIERKRTAEWLQRMQALLRAQARARAGRVQMSESSLSNSSSKSSHFHHPGPPTPEKFEHSSRTRSGKYDQSFMLKRTVSKSNNRAAGDQEAANSFLSYSERRMDDRSWDQRVPSRKIGPAADEDKGDKILEIDTGKSHSAHKRGKLFHAAQHFSLASDHYTHSYSTSRDTMTHQTPFSPSSGEVQSLSPLQFCNEVEEAFCTAENSPQYYSASSRGGTGRRSPFTPTKSDGSRSFLSGYSDYPNYMSNTESSRAKVRSLSAPKQRPQYERSSSTKRYSIGEPRSSSVQRASALRASFASKAYPGSGRLDSLGMPMGHRY